MKKLETQTLTAEISAKKQNKVVNYIKNHTVLVIGILLVLLLAGLGSWQFQQNLSLKRELGQLKGDKGASDAEIKDLVNKVGKHITLPEEEPTVATVTDPQKLSDQKFFDSAKVDDKVLIFTKAKKAILYRPSEDKIIEVAPVNIGEDNVATPASDQDQSQITDKSTIQVQIQNASKIAGLAKKVADKFKAQGFTNVTVSDAPSGVSDVTTITYGQRYKDITADANKILNDQAKVEVQIGLQGLVVVLGTNFSL